MNKFLTILALLGVLASCHSGKKLPQEENSLLWKIESPGSGEASYLFGTYHLVGSDYLESHQKVEDTYEGASTVVVEMVVDSSQIMQVAMLGMMPGKSLKNMIDSADYVLVKQEVQAKLGIDITMLDQMKPMMISTMYAMAMAEESTPEEFSYDGQPIDMYFAVDGKKKGKEVVALETMLEQAHMLMDSIPLEEQAEALVELVREKELGQEMTTEILKAYREEDLNAMWKYADSMGESYGDMNMLIDDRNKRWMKTLDPLLRQGDVFIGVGALHLPGENGILELLRKQGFSVSPVK